MIETISQSKLKNMIETNQPFTLIETLPHAEYEKFHLPGAINVPNDKEFETAILEAVPSMTRTVVVYCWDADCNSSEIAAKKMQKLGYSNVLDYAEGKKDWRDAGLEVVEGASAPVVE